jgi:hypothetical protein
MGRDQDSEQWEGRSISYSTFMTSSDICSKTRVLTASAGIVLLAPAKSSRTVLLSSRRLLIAYTHGLMHLPCSIA